MYSSKVHYFKDNKDFKLVGQSEKNGGLLFEKGERGQYKEGMRDKDH